MLSKMVKKNANLFSIALSMQEKQPNFKDLDENENKVLSELLENGVVAIPNFFSEDECKQMIESFESLDEKYARFREDKRIFGIQCLSDVHKKLFYENKFMKKIAEAYLGEEVYLQTTMAAKIEPKEGERYGSGGGWHRDSFSRQFKAITYLNDVEIENGPFMYIKGSHKLENIKKVLKELKRDIPGDYRYTDDEIKKIQGILGEEITYLIAPKGSLVLADIRGLHTGMPIQKGVRYSVFNYYIAKSARKPGNNIEKLNEENCRK